MNYWRMSFRCGIRGFEMFEKCINENVAAITYSPLIYTDLSKYSYLEPKDSWKKLKPTQSASLKRFVYEIKKNDIIYVKQGRHIVGRGKVINTYQFKRKTSIICPKKDIPWCHHIPIKWEDDFIPINILLGAEQFTVIPLNTAQLNLISKEQDKVKVTDDNISAIEGEQFKSEVTFRKRNRALIEAKKTNSDGTCEVCGFNYIKYYKGLFKKNYLVAHHLQPIAMREGGTKTTIDDIALICSNCHTAVHSTNPPMTMNELKKKIRSRFK